MGTHRQPYDPMPRQVVDFSDAELCGYVSVAGAIAPLQGGGQIPALVFMFRRVDGTETRPILFVIDPDAQDVQDVTDLISTAGAHAIKVANGGVDGG